MKNKILNIINRIKKERNEEFIKTYCDVGTFLDNGGAFKGGVCQCVPAEEIINFMSVTEALIIDAIEKADKNI